MGSGTRFAWQHDARHVGDGSTLTLFDNSDDPQVAPQSRGLALSLDLAKKRATLLHQYVHNPKMLAHAFGSVQTQPNGNVLVGWGTEPYFTEYTADGAVVYDAKLPHGGQNYRTLRFPWVGKPTEAPRAVARPAAAGHVLYVTWNGATDVHSWQLLTGPSRGSLTAAGTFRRTGFETALQVPAGRRYAAAAALDAAGKPLGRSAPVALG
jgi:hypothetical protein